MLAFAVLLPTVDPVSLAFEVIPLLVLFEISIWLSVIMERRWNRNLPDEEEFGSASGDEDTPEDDAVASDGVELESSRQTKTSMTRSMTTRSCSTSTSRDSRRIAAVGGRDPLNVISADWVVPVEGPPIESGAVAIADDGTIEAVGSIDDLGQGDHHEGCVIIPGLVNAHSHLEYAVYAGFGDGLPFVPGSGCTFNARTRSTSTT